MLTRNNSYTLPLPPRLHESGYKIKWFHRVTYCDRSSYVRWLLFHWFLLLLLFLIQLNYFLTPFPTYTSTPLLSLLLFDTPRLFCGGTSACQSISLLWGEIWWRASPTLADQSVVLKKSISLSQWGAAASFGGEGLVWLFGRAPWQTAVLC